MLGVIGLSWITDPDVYLERGLPNDDWGTDAGWLSAVARLAIPVGAAAGLGVACLGYCLALAYARQGKIWNAAALAALTAGLFAALFSEILSFITGAPFGTPVLIGLIAAALGLALTHRALVRRAAAP